MKDDSSQERIVFVHLILTAECLAAELVPGAKYWDSERERPASSSMHSSPLSQAFTSISLERTGGMTAGRHLGSRISWFVNTTSFKPLVPAAGLGSGHFEAK